MGRPDTRGRPDPQEPQYMGHTGAHRVSHTLMEASVLPFKIKAPSQLCFDRLLMKSDDGPPLLE